MTLIGQPVRPKTYRERLEGLWDPSASDGCGAEIERIRQELFGVAKPVDPDDQFFQWAIADAALRYAQREWRGP